MSEPSSVLMSQKRRQSLLLKKDSATATCCLCLFSSICLTYICVAKEVIQQLQLQVVESDHRIANYVRKFNKIRANYNNLIGVTVELVESLEATLSGEKVSRLECGARHKLNRWHTGRNALLH